MDDEVCLQLAARVMHAVARHIYLWGADGVLFSMPPYLLLATILLVIFALLFRQRRRTRIRLPPGPRKLPVLGNLLDMPSSFEWETYMEWSRAFNSDIIHLDIAGSSIIVLSSPQATTDLLEKRSTLYSDRPRLPMVNELMGWNFNFSFMKYGDRWRKLRRLFHQDFNADGMVKYFPKHRTACHELLRRLLRDPDRFLEHMRHMAGDVIMSTVYGIQVRPENDPYIQTAEDALRTLVYASIPGRFLVDLIPALMHVPEWFPGAGFKRTARKWRELSKDLVLRPFEETKRQLASDSAVTSFASSLLTSLPDSEHELVKQAAGTTYSAGADTTVSILGSFVLAMLANPEAQQKAQLEIDSVCCGILPDFELFANAEKTMPFVCAVMREVLRWRPALPLVPHFLQTEDEYRGLRIPAQSIILANIWGILHDETTYPNPHSFLPERWLLPSGALNPAMQGWELAFGFGRRVCVGRHFALASVWMTIVSLLATFEIHKAVDENGVLVEPTHEYVSGLVMQPVPFRCSIKPRSPEAESAIRETERV
ncbi:cytochrome P450 [Mycena amicta]|nr:cytochrome P450 [Mycena amicta]